MSTTTGQKTKQRLQAAATSQGVPAAPELEGAGRTSLPLEPPEGVRPCDRGWGPLGLRMRRAQLLAGSAPSVILYYSSCRAPIRQDGGQVPAGTGGPPRGGSAEFREGTGAEVWEVGEGSARGGLSGKQLWGWPQAGPWGGTQQGVLQMPQTLAPVSCGASLLWTLREATCRCSCRDVVGGERVCRKKWSVPHGWTVHLDVRGQRPSL